ncbi:MAG: type 4a pilus biogenesis protein PilO [Vicinamibacterales bacterium]
MASLSVTKLTWPVQVALFVILAGGLCAAFYYQVEEPQQLAIGAKRAELADIQARIERGREMARQLPDFRRQITDLEARLASLKPILPEEKDVADLLRRIQTLATQSNLTIRGFRPEAINTRELHAEWPIGLELEGTYHNLGLFLDRVSKFPRIINVGDIAITARREPAPHATIDVSCTATTFVLIEQPAAAAEVTPNSKNKKGAPAKKAPVKKTE